MLTFCEIFVLDKVYRVHSSCSQQEPEKGITMVVELFALSATKSSEYILEHPGQYTIWYSPLDSGGSYPSLSILCAPLMPRN